VAIVHEPSRRRGTEAAFRKFSASRRIGAASVVLMLGGASLAAQAPLAEAVKRGDAAALRALVAQRVDVNAAEPDGTTALHWAAQRNDVATLERLLRAGADARAANRYGVTPIYLAALNGSAPAIRALVAAGADANTAMPDGETVVMTAARTGDAGAIRALVEAGADVNAREPTRGQTALMWAAAEGNVDAIRALVAAGADVDARSHGGSFSALLFAVRGGHIAAARALVEAGADVNQTLSDGTSALVLAVINAHYELASVLLDLGADPDASAQGWTALHQIAWSRRPNAGFNLPGPVATGSVDSLDLVAKLVRHGADVNARITKEPRDGNRNLLDRIGGTPFLMAAKSADVPLMKTLLESGADPRLTTRRGTTALMVAAGVGIWAPGENPGTHDEALAAMRLALEVGGGGVNDVDQDGETALHGAVYRGGNIKAIEFLIANGARLDVVNKKGWLPVTAADGVEYTPAVLKRYPEAAALLRREMRARGLPVPGPVHSVAAALAEP
jgi:ankyrin repeat protein